MYKIYLFNIVARWGEGGGWMVNATPRRERVLQIYYVSCDRIIT